MNLSYLLLLPVFLVCVFGSMISYTDAYRRSSWFLPVFLFLGLIVNGAFGYATKNLDDKQKIYIYALCFDAVIMSAYYILPIVLFSTRLKPSVMCGAIFVGIGFLVIKIFG